MQLGAGSRGLIRWCKVSIWFFSTVDRGPTRLRDRGRIPSFTGLGEGKRGLGCLAMGRLSNHIRKPSIRLLSGSRISEEKVEVL